MVERRVALARLLTEQQFAKLIGSDALSESRAHVNGFSINTCK
jgi:hypothetical protein